MVAVSDAGYWFHARLEREDDSLTGLREMQIAPMLDADGREFRYKYQIDAEGLERVGDVWLVSTERDIRVLAYRGDPFERPVPGRTVRRPTGPPLRGNRGLEAIAGHPNGRQIALSEDSLDTDGNIRAFDFGPTVAGGSRTISVRKRGSFAITDAAFLPDGSLLLLERRFDLAGGPGLRIRGIARDDLGFDAPLDGEVLIEVGLPHQIDNMEGLAVSPHPDGHRLTLVSDDNRSLLQRTLLLEFLLRE